MRWGELPINSTVIITDTTNMAKAPKALAFTFASLLALGACGSDPVEEQANTETSSSAEAVTELVSEGAEPVEADTSDDSPTEDPVVEDITTDEETTETVVEEEPIETCDAPELQPHYVDVSLDDPDGGLNVRSGAGVDNDVIVTIERSGELISTGNCEVVGTVDWWEVSTSDGSLTGWASSRFLSDLPVFNPGLGKAIEDTDNVGVGGSTLEEMAEAIAEAYGFDEDGVITQEGEVIGIDAQGGSVTYIMTGLKDDASNGYQVEIDFLLDKNETEDGEEIESYTALRITNYALCSRGVTEDGLCI